MMNWLTLAQDGGADQGFDPTVIIGYVKEYGEPLMWAVIILILTFYAAKLANNFTRSGLERSKVDETVSRFLARIAQYTVLAMGIVFALGKFNITLTSIAAIFVAAGFAVGMALSGTLSSFAAGVMLLTFRPFKVGQIVNAAGITAKVVEIELFCTTFDTFDNRRIIVPNATIYGSTIENISYHEERRVDVGVGVEYSADIDKTREVLEKAAASIDNIIAGEGRGTQVLLGDLGDSSVNWTVRAWVPAAEFWPSKQALTRAIKMHLDEAGIGIPFPQMDVHLDKTGA
jgi:small conductance mechanosensitive channel